MTFLSCSLLLIKLLKDVMSLFSHSLELAQFVNILAQFVFARSYFGNKLAHFVSVTDLRSAEDQMSHLASAFHIYILASYT